MTNVYLKESSSRKTIWALSFKSWKRSSLCVPAPKILILILLYWNKILIASNGKVFKSSCTTAYPQVQIDNTYFGKKITQITLLGIFCYNWFLVGNIKTLFFLKLPGLCLMHAYFILYIIKGLSTKFYMRAIPIFPIENACGHVLHACCAWLIEVCDSVLKRAKFC